MLFIRMAFYNATLKSRKGGQRQEEITVRAVSKGRIYFLIYILQRFSYCDFRGNASSQLSRIALMRN